MRWFPAAGGGGSSRFPSSRRPAPPAAPGSPPTTAPRRPSLFPSPSPSPLLSLPSPSLISSLSLCCAQERAQDPPWLPEAPLPASIFTTTDRIRPPQLAHDWIPPSPPSVPPDPVALILQRPASPFPASSDRAIDPDDARVNAALRGPSSDAASHQASRESRFHHRGFLVSIFLSILGNIFLQP